jgi:hypothetical protein
MTTGYSGTPLVTKLGIKAHSTVRLVAAPFGFEGLLAPLPEGVRIRRAGAVGADVVVFFSTSYDELAGRIDALARGVFPNGSLWVAWPKKASGVSTDLTEDVVRDIVLPIGLVDNKVCAITDVWSGLRLVWRKENR